MSLTLLLFLLDAVTVELLSLLLAVPFAVLSVGINPLGGNAVGLDPNVALFAAGLVIYAVFNYLFYVNFYTTGYKVGTSFLKATIPMAVVMLALEVLPHLPGLDWLTDTTLSGNLRQLPLLALGAVLYAISAVLTIRIAGKRYEKVDL